MREAIVTGANGFIGSNLVRELLCHNVKVYGVIRNIKSNLDRLPLDDDGLIILYQDLDRIDKLELPEDAKPDIWYHFAWQDCNTSKRADVNIQMSNVTNAVKSVKTAKRLGCARFIGIGTVAEFTIPYVLTGGITAQNCIYAITKDYTNKILTLICNELNMEYIWCRLSNIYGEGDRTQNLVRYTIQSLQNNVTPEYTTAVQPYNFLNIIDCREALYVIGNSTNYISQVFLGGDEVKTLKCFLWQIRDIVKPNAVLGIGARPDDGAIYKEEWFDNGALKRVFGVSPRITFEEGIKRLKKEFEMQNKGKEHD